MQALYPEFCFSGHMYSNRVAYICILSTLSVREEAETGKHPKIHVPANLLHTLAYRKRHCNSSKVESKDQNPRLSSDPHTRTILYASVFTNMQTPANKQTSTHREIKHT